MGLGRFLGVLLVWHAAAQAQSGVISTIAGRTAVNGGPIRGGAGDGGPAVAASLGLANFDNLPCDPNRFEQTSHISVDTKGNLYLADSSNQRVRRIDPSGAITTVAGNGDSQSRCAAAAAVGDGGNAIAARLFSPADVLPLPNGSLIIADQQNNRIRQLSAPGTISTVVGNGLHFPYIPGAQGTASAMDWPSALAVDASGVVYFAELHSNRVGKIVNGVLSTVAGTGNPADLNKPAGIAIDGGGALVIADTGNHRVRRVVNGTMTTIAGTGRAGFCGDGARAADACLNSPMDVKADALGSIYIADTGNHRVRRIDTAGLITTVAGTGDPGRGADAVPAETSALNFPSALAVDANNDLYIVDWQNYLIRKVTFGGAPAIASGGVLNAASGTARVAPGSLISIYGANFSAEVAAGDFAPEVKGVRVEINGHAAPLSVITPGQINAQLAYDVGGTATAVVVTPAGHSTPATFTVEPAAVGIFVYPGSDRAIAAHTDYSLNGPANPVGRGGALTFYVTGLGAVTPPVATGQAAPSDRLCYANATVTATVGGADAQVLFAGLTPGFIGLAQVNVIVPAEAETGDAVPVVIQTAGVTSRIVTVSVR
jgi:uncharacterized protein (TIGR03437 family)